MKTPLPKMARARLRRFDARDADASGSTSGDAATGPEVRRFRTRWTDPNAIAIANPTATGVNELRPPEAIAAHQAASTKRPDASPTPTVSAAGAPGFRRPTSRATRVPNTRHTAANRSASPIDSQTLPSEIATVKPEAA